MTAHYADHVIIEDDAALTPEQIEELTALQEAVHAVKEAEKAKTDAITHRKEVARKAWPVLANLGAPRVAQLVGGDSLTVSTLRGDVSDVARTLKQQRAGTK